MSTTSLFVEILIIGMEALVWIGLLLSIKWDASPCLAWLEQNSAYSALFTTVLLTLAYVVGIFVDRVADCFYTMFRFSTDQPLPMSFGKMRLKIMHESEGMAKFLDYQRSRLRIARSTFVNLLALFLIGLYWTIPYFNKNVPVAILIHGSGIAVLLICLTVSKRIDEAQLSRLNEAYEIISEATMDAFIAAAVCYRINNMAIEFLLVRTKGGKYWTFPKGHIEKDRLELPWVAAQREAGEEAGASGPIEKELLTNYLYRKGDNKEAELVAAYLMCVISDQDLHEDGRDPQWFTPKQAMTGLAEHRGKKYAREHHRVIRKALCKLSEYCVSK